MHSNAVILILSFSGIDELRSSIIQFHTRLDKITFDKDNVVVGPGSKELIYLLLSVFNGGT